MFLEHEKDIDLVEHKSKKTHHKINFVIELYPFIKQIDIYKETTKIIYIKNYLSVV
jgi:hypothetical protein